MNCCLVLPVPSASESGAVAVLRRRARRRRCRLIHLQRPLASWPAAGFHPGFHGWRAPAHPACFAPHRSTPSAPPATAPSPPPPPPPGSSGLPWLPLGVRRRMSLDLASCSWARRGCREHRLPRAPASRAPARRAPARRAPARRAPARRAPPRASPRRRAGVCSLAPRAATMTQKRTRRDGGAWNLLRDAELLEGRLLRNALLLHSETMTRSSARSAGCSATRAPSRSSSTSCSPKSTAGHTYRSRRACCCAVLAETSSPQRCRALLAEADIARTLTIATTGVPKEAGLRRHGCVGRRQPCLMRRRSFDKDQCRNWFSVNRNG